MTISTQFNQSALNINSQLAIYREIQQSIQVLTQKLNHLKAAIRQIEIASKL